MKKLRILTLSLLSASFVFMTSCKDDGDSLGPSLEMTELSSGATGGTITVAPNTQLMFRWVARSGDSKLETFEISHSGVNTVSPLPTSNNGNSFPYSVKNADNDNYVDTVMFDAGTNNGNTTYNFTVIDNDGNEESKSFTVTVQASTPMNTEVTGAFFHIQGTLQGAYDLVNETARSAGDPEADKDMKNTDGAGVTFTGSWASGTGNGTMFVKSNGFDYANATVEAAAAAYNGGTPSSTVTNPANNDIYVAKLRGGSNYAVIKITNVDPTDNTCACGNLGKISFDYKKQ